MLSYADIANGLLAAVPQKRRDQEKYIRIVDPALIEHKTRRFLQAQALRKKRFVLSERDRETLRAGRISAVSIQDACEL